MNVFRRSVILLSIAGTLHAQTHQLPRNLVILIGDGMGVTQVTAGRTKKGTLELERFTTMGLLVTHAAGKDYITDSAAGATALSSGIKTYNGAIGVRPDSTPVETLFERAKKRGKKTGLVTVCSITHATPASFVSHVPSRTMQLEIAEQIAAGPTDICLGSGWGWFLPTAAGGRRTDGKNLLAAMRERGYTYVSTDERFRALAKEEGKVIGLFAENHVGTAQERKPSLKEMTKWALHSLARSESGFVLLVEGSQIDWAGHDNKSDQIMTEMADFDDAVGAVMDFAVDDGNTLVIVTADHETGGYSLNGGSLTERSVVGKFTTDGHTAAMVPLFAFGPQAVRFGGIRQNSEVGELLLHLLQ